MTTLAQHPLSRELYPLGMGYYPRAQGHQMSRQQHEDHLLLYCQAGKGRVQAGGNDYLVGKGGLVLLPQGMSHQYQADADDPWSLYWVHFSGSQSRAFVDHLALPTPVVSLGQHPRLIADFDSLLQVRSTGYNINAFIHAAQILKQMLSYLALLATRQIRQTGHPLDLDAIQSCMEEHLGGNLNLEQIAAMANLSKYHFSKRYKALTGYSPIQHFIHLKIERACYMLDISTDPVGIVAASLGFEDTHYFSRLFRKVTGISPSQYRQLDKG